MSEAAVLERKVDIKNQLWYHTHKNGKTDVGFTEDFLASCIRDCWHITPAAKRSIKERSPLITVETNDSQFTVTSPIGGDVLSFSDNAMNFPDKLKESDVICVLGETSSRLKAKVVFNDPATEFFANTWRTAQPMNWDVPPPAPVAADNDGFGLAVPRQEGAVNQTQRTVAQMWAEIREREQAERRVRGAVNPQ
jgi:glycine cleavage system H lipoate-binding protein